MNRTEPVARAAFRGGSGLALTVLVAAALLAAPARGSGQAVTATAIDSSATYEREVFEYPAAGRRNPFLPLNAGQRVGPRFDDLQLNGVVFAPEAGSVATLTDQKTGRRYRVRVGERLGGEIRVAEIRVDAVTFVITSYGISRREVLRVKKDQEEEISG